MAKIHVSNGIVPTNVASTARYMKEVKKYCNEKGYYIGEYWFKSKQR